MAVYLDPNGVVTYAYPTVFLGQLQPGFNFLTHFPNVSFSNAIREPLFFTGPFTDSSGRNFVNAFVPIWADAATSDTDFGYGVLECAECWDPMLGRKLFGSTRSLVSLDILLAKSPLFSLVDDGLRFTVQGRQLPPGDINSLSNPIIFSSDKENYCKYDERRLHVENFPINVRNLKWELCAYTQEFSPAWFPLAVSGSIIISMFLAVLITALIVERSHGNAILREILPSKVIDHLKQGAGPYSEKYEKVTILFCDIVGFTPLSSMLDPAQIVNMLDDLYTKYDKLTEKHGVYKVETIGRCLIWLLALDFFLNLIYCVICFSGDAYMCVCGCPNRRNPSVAALRMVGLARDIIKTASTFRKSYFPPGYKFQVRVGLHSGDVVAGVVGMKMPRFCLFGDAVNTASRMESNSKPMRIQVSMTTAKLLRKRKPKDIVEFARYHTLYQTDDYYLASRGKLMIKGKGEMKTFFVVNRSDTDQEGVDDHSDTASDVTVKDFFDENASDTASSAGDDDGAPFFHAPTCKAPKFLATLPRLESNRSFNGEENVEDTIIELELSRTALSGPPSRMTTPIVSTQSHPTISVASISKEASVSEKHKESYIMKAVAQFLRKDSEVVKASEYEKIAIDSGCSIEL